jgi:hypothetical protein
MSYSISRNHGVRESRVQDLEADTAVHLLLDWSVAYPTERLTICDDAGVIVAYRLPRALTMSA